MQLELPLIDQLGMQMVAVKECANHTAHTLQAAQDEIERLRTKLAEYEQPGDQCP